MECPACSGPVSLDVGPERPLSASHPDALLAADEGERFEITRTCWDCGWQEARQVHIESIGTTEGDEVVIEWAALIDEIDDEFAAIDSVATLEDTLAEVRRQRRFEAASTDSDEVTFE